MHRHPPTFTRLLGDRVRSVKLLNCDALHRSFSTGGLPDCRIAGNTAKSRLLEATAKVVADAGRSLLGNFSDVVSELFIGVARIAGGSFGFHDSEHVAACV